MYLLSCIYCHVPIVMYLLSCIYCHVPIVMYLLSSTYCHVSIVMYLLSCTYCHVSIVLYVNFVDLPLPTNISGNEQNNAWVTWVFNKHICLQGMELLYQSVERQRERGRSKSHKKKHRDKKRTHHSEKENVTERHRHSDREREREREERRSRSRETVDRIERVDSTMVRDLFNTLTFSWQYFSINMGYWIFFPMIYVADPRGQSPLPPHSHLTFFSPQNFYPWYLYKNPAFDNTTMSYTFQPFFKMAVCSPGSYLFKIKYKFM